MGPAWLERTPDGDRRPFAQAFCEPDGKPLSSTGMRKRFLRTRAAAGLRPLRFRDLRHTFRSIAVREVDTATPQA